MIHTSRQSILGVCLFTCLVWALPVRAQEIDAPADEGERYALLVGIEDYPGTANDLPGIHNDIKRMRGLLVDVFGFRERNVQILEDEEATPRAIVAAFQDHLGQAGPGDVAVFYYSGHGTRLPQNVLLPDAEEDARDEAIYVWAGPGESPFIVDDELGFMTSTLSAENVLVILESCNSGTGTRRAGALPKQVDFEPLDGVSLPRDPVGEIGRRENGDATQAGEGMTRDFLDVLSEPRNHILVAASEASQYSYTIQWPDGTWGSVLTRFLDDELRRTDGRVSFREAILSVGLPTMLLTAGFERGLQSPRVEGARANELIATYLETR